MYGSAYLAAETSTGDAGVDGRPTVQAHEASAPPAPSSAPPSSPHIIPHVSARTSTSVPNNVGMGNGGTVTGSIPKSIGARSTPNNTGTASTTAAPSQDSSTHKGARAPSNGEGMGVASRESSMGFWPSSLGPAGVADFKAASARAADTKAGKAAGATDFKAEGVDVGADAECWAGTWGAVNGNSNGAACAGGAGGGGAAGGGAAGAGGAEAGGNGSGNSGSLPAPVAVALGGRSERYVPAAGARSGVGGLAGGSGTTTHTRSPSPLARGTTMLQLPTGISQSTSFREQVSRSADPATDSPIYKLKQLLKLKKSNHKGGLSRSNTSGNF
mmetsp:Transcript_18298/g.51313  ORF Transcript_18298/g.51313 Transcript_18298/m.51313 type:complete len:329 (+) Transcript_18298:793-1779(+)